MKDRGGLRDLIVRVIVLDDVDEVDCASPAVAVFADVDVDVDVPASVMMGSGGWTTGIYEHGRRMTVSQTCGRFIERGIDTPAH